MYVCESSLDEDWINYVMKQREAFHQSVKFQVYFRGDNDRV